MYHSPGAATESAASLPVVASLCVFLFIAASSIGVAAPGGEPLVTPYPTLSFLQHDVPACTEMRPLAVQGTSSESLWPDAFSMQTVQVWLPSISA